MSAAGLELFPSAEEAARRAASLTAKALSRAVDERGRGALALSGGTTPGRFFELLAGEDLPWERLHLFWADERLLPPDDPASNFLLARERLLSRAPLPQANAHPMLGPHWPGWREALAAAGLPEPSGRGARPLRQAHGDNPAEGTSSAGSAWADAPGILGGPEAPGADNASLDLAARLYERRLLDFFGGAGTPVFDVIHLGLGGDGHTASLFPGQPALEESRRWVLPVVYAGAKPPVPRLTLTLPVLNAARTVFFLISGADKLPIAQDILAGRGAAYPAARVVPADGALWLSAGS